MESEIKALHWWDNLTIDEKIQVYETLNVPVGNIQEDIKSLYKEYLKLGKYILVYYTQSTGVKCHEFSSAEAMHEKVSHLSNKRKELIDIIYAGKLVEEYRYTAIATVTEYKPELL